VADGAIQVDSERTAWRLPPGSYFKGDTTLTMWVKRKKFKCGTSYGKLLIIFFYDLKLQMKKKLNFSFKTNLIRLKSYII
jgi:hypothetical protein